MHIRRDFGPRIVLAVVGTIVKVHSSFSIAFDCCEYCRWVDSELSPDLWIGHLEIVAIVQKLFHVKAADLLIQSIHLLFCLILPFFGSSFNVGGELLMQPVQVIGHGQPLLGEQLLYFFGFFPCEHAFLLIEL